MTTLFVSPHFDDVALSCAGTLLARRARGARVVVATVFGADGARARDDARALALASAEQVVLGFDDAPVRERITPSFTSLVLDAPVRPALVRAVRRALAALIARTRPHEVWLPLGVGGHVDHRTVFEAALALVVPRRRFYEERPYGLVPALVRLRRRELAGGAPIRLAPEAILAQLAACGCGAMIGAREREHVGHELARRLAGPVSRRMQLVRRIVRHDPRTLAPAMAIAAQHRAEVRWLFDGEPVLAVWRRLARRERDWIERYAVLR